MMQGDVVQRERPFVLQRFNCSRFLPPHTQTSAATSAPTKASAPPDATTCDAPEVEPPLDCAAAAAPVPVTCALEAPERDDAAEPVDVADDAAEVDEAAAAAVDW